MKVVRNKNKAFELDIKRLYLPFKVVDNCPKCGVEVTFDLNTDYFMRNKANQDFDHTMCCPDPCNHDWKVKLHLRIVLRKAVP